MNHEGKQSEAARCSLVGTEVVCTGNKDLIGSLAVQGVRTRDGKTFLPKDGVAFLTALHSVYKSPYLFATEVQEGE